MVSPNVSTWPQILSVVLVCVATLGVGALGLRLSRTTSDFYVASRVVSPRSNAFAICGEYLSAASFLGVAGLVLAFGVDILWYPVGYTAGYLVLLALVAAPLRRSGAYTLPDFAEIRLQSPLIRRIASVLVVGIGWLYLLPQFQGAGLALRTVTGAPKWVGALVVALVVLLNVVAGGMRSITIVQAFQFWLKLTAIALPVALPGPGLVGGRPARPRGHGASRGPDDDHRAAARHRHPGRRSAHPGGRARDRQRATGGRAGRPRPGQGRPAGGHPGDPARRDRPSRMWSRSRASTGKDWGTPTSGHRRSGPCAVPAVLPAAGTAARHHGVAACPGALLHQPRRQGCATDHPGGHRTARIVLPVPALLRRNGPGVRTGPADDRTYRRGGSPSAATDAARAMGPAASRPW